MGDSGVSPKGEEGREGGREGVREVDEGACTLAVAMVRTRGILEEEGYVS